MQIILRCLLKICTKSKLLTEASILRKYFHEKLLVQKFPKFTNVPITRNSCYLSAPHNQLNFSSYPTTEMRSDGMSDDMDSIQIQIIVIRKPRNKVCYSFPRRFYIVDSEYVLDGYVEGKAGFSCQRSPIDDNEVIHNQ